jgi:hypothetical protein
LNSHPIQLNRWYYNWVLTDAVRHPIRITLSSIEFITRTFLGDSFLPDFLYPSVLADSNNKNLL